MMWSFRKKCLACSSKLTKRESRMNAGVCDTCLADGLRKVARGIAERDGIPDGE